MRICVMAPWPSVHTDYWLRALCAIGHEVHLLQIGSLRSDGLPEKVKAHPIIRQWRIRFTGQISMGLELRRTLRRINPDILHIHTVFAGRRWVELPLLLAMYTFHPLVISPWGGDIMVSPNASWSARLLIQFALRSADRVTAISQTMLDVAADLGVARERLHQIQVGIDTELFSPDQDTKSLRTKLRLGPGPVVYSTRAFTPTYNLLTIAAAIPKVLEVLPECRFIFQRRSDFHNPEYEAQVQQRLEQLDATHAVRIIPPMQNRDLPPYYALADVIVSVPSHDGMPVSVQEAMACGAFPIVSDLPALRERICHGQNGLIINAVDPQTIAEAIIYALSNRELLAEARPKNREIIQTRASYDFWLHKLDELYRELL